MNCTHASHTHLNMVDQLENCNVQQSIFKIHFNKKKMQNCPNENFILYRSVTNLSNVMIFLHTN